MTRVPGLLGVFLLATVAAVADPGGVGAQTGGDAAPDSTAVPTGGLAAASAYADSVSADSTLVDRDALREAAAAVPVPFFWMRGPSLTLSGDVRANVSQVELSGSVEATAAVLGGYSASTTLTQANTSFRQLERDVELRGLDASLRGGRNRWANLNLTLSRNTSNDVNVVAGRDIVIESDDKRAALLLDGKQYLPGRIKWALSGSVLDVQANNRGTNNDRQLAEGGATTRWKQQVLPGTTLSARAGGARASGSRQLRGLEVDATTAQDTVGTSLEITRGQPFTINLDLDRIWFDETRLDFRRNSDGVIDTLNAPEGELKVAAENEKQRSDRLSLRFDSRLLPVVAVGGTYRREFTETTYTFSQEGTLQSGLDRVDADLDFRYADAGSLQAKVSWGDTWNDRRSRGADRFRGRDNRVTKEASLQLLQKVYRRTDLDIKVSQRLSQSIFGEVANKNDRDQLDERIDATLRSKALPRLVLNLGGTIRRTDIVNTDSERVGNNKEDRLFEVTGSYNLQATDRLSFDQSVKMQIVYNDFHNSNDRDQFNKQGQMTAGAALDVADGSEFTADYTLDFRSTGRRFDDGRRRVVAYQTNLRSFDHQLRLALSIPLPFVTLTLNSQRAFLRRENPSVGESSRTEEDRGEFRAVLSGGRKFLDDRMDFRVDVTRVLAFGPRVREENEDYWIANSGFSLRF